MINKIKNALTAYQAAARALFKRKNSKVKVTEMKY